MAIYNQGIPAKTFEARAVSIHVMLEGSGLWLTKTIDIKNGHQIVQLLDSCKAQSLPDATLSTFTITNETVGSVKDMYLAHGNTKKL